MIANLVGGFVAILVGVSFIGPLAQATTNMTSGLNSTGGACIAQNTGVVADIGCQLNAASSWGSTVLNLVPGFFALAILGIGLAVTYASLRQAGVL